MIDRVPSGFHPFVIPFLVGMAFVLGYCLFGVLRIMKQLSWKERRKLLVSLVTPEMIVKNIRDIFFDCLFHVKLWKRNKLLGYMHSSIAFGWFMLIVLGHLEVILFVPKRINLFYYPIFFNYFVAEDEMTLRGSLLFFLMDFFLLVVLSGIVLAMVKRVSSRFFGMRRTARPSFLNLVGLYALWAIFPLRLLAESFTAHISGGSFLTIPANWVFRQFLGNELNMLPTWWAYSIALGVFMCVLPFTRYMHIPAEMLLIPMRNAGLKMVNARKGFTRVQVLSCPNCGVCVDACPMSANRANLKDCTVYLTRQVRRGNERRIAQISDKCLMCGKCKVVCQVGVDGAELRRLQREDRTYGLKPDYSNINLESSANGKVLYFGGCMTQLTPAIGRSVESILKKSAVDYVWMDRDGGICCGRPLYMAGRTQEAEALVRKNEEIIKKSGADVLLVSCPICYKMFLEQYDLGTIKVEHYVPYILDLVKSGRIHLKRSVERCVYHDPCELGRGCGMYEEPRELLGRVVQVCEADKNREMSVCCGGSLGSLSLDFAQREKITCASLENLYASGADVIATACPLCKTTYQRYSDRPVRDLAEIIDCGVVTSD